MKAAVNHRYGAPHVLSIAEVERPGASPQQILIQVHASTVTEGDRRLRAADYPGFSALFGRLVTGLFRPRQPVGGSTFAGKVVEAGALVTRFQVGDDVFGSTMNGCYAEYLAIASTDAVATMPRGVSYAEAAALPYGAGTAQTFLHDLARVQPEERVLIVGASGGVGRMAVQLAKHFGAHVTGLCSRDAELVRQWGADAVIDYKKEDFTQRGEKWDVILDTTEGNHFRSFRRVLTPVGRYLTLYVTFRVLMEMLWTKLRGGPRALTGVALGTPLSSDKLRDLVEQKAFSAVIAKRFPLEQIKEAHLFFESSRPHGTVVIDISRPQARSQGPKSTPTG